MRLYRSVARNHYHLYGLNGDTRGHRTSSFSTVDLMELTELRARQRTFEGAYRRTALANLGYALTVLRLFDVRFYKSFSYLAIQLDGGDARQHLLEVLHAEDVLAVSNDLQEILVTKSENVITS